MRIMQRLLASTDDHALWLAGTEGIEKKMETAIGFRVLGLG